MVWEKLKEELIIPGLEAKSSDDIFEALGGKLVKQGYCKESYVQALKDRQYRRKRSRNSTYRRKPCKQKRNCNRNIKTTSRICRDGNG